MQTDKTLTLEQWLNMLPPQATHAQESVLWVTKCTQPLKIRADIWRSHFKGYAGCTIEPGKALQIVPADAGKRNLALPDWVLNQLGIEHGDRVCITRKAGHTYLKRFDIEHLTSTIPGLIAYDQHSDGVITRKWSCFGTPQDVTLEHARRIVELVGHLKVDPVAQLCALEGKTGYLARKNLLRATTTADAQFAESYRQRIIDKQLEDGSWDDNALESAFNIMDLLEMGATPQNDAIQRGVDWLLHLPEPIGAPGTFNANQEITELYNRFKTENPKGRVSAYDKIAKDRHRRAEFMPYLGHGDVFGMPNEFCDARHMFVTGIVLQALLQCGLEREHRVNKALHTLLERPWCQDYYRENTGESVAFAPVDFNKPEYADNQQVKFRTWTLNEAGVLNLTSSTGLQGGDTYVSRHTSCGCPIMISRALSYHSQWPGSLIQMRTAAGLVSRLGWDWSHMHAYPSFIFSHLARLGTPIAAFGAARYVPMLKSTQQADGFWDESERLFSVSGRRKHVKFVKGGIVPPLKREQAAYLICMSLKSLGLLSLMRPQERGIQL